MITLHVTVRKIRQTTYEQEISTGARSHKKVLRQGPSKQRDCQEEKKASWLAATVCKSEVRGIRYANMLTYAKASASKNIAEKCSVGSTKATWVTVRIMT